MTRLAKIGMGCELMKLLRDNLLSRKQIAELLDWEIGAVDRWTAEYEAHGLLAAHRAPAALSASGRGRSPMLYTVAPTWRGNGAAP